MSGVVDGQHVVADVELRDGDPGRGPRGEAAADPDAFALGERIAGRRQCIAATRARWRWNMLTCGGFGRICTPGTSGNVAASAMARARHAGMFGELRIEAHRGGGDVRVQLHQRAAHALAPDARLGDERLGAGERGAGERADALVERYVDRIEQRADVGVAARRVRFARLPQPRAVHVQADVARRASPCAVRPEFSHAGSWPPISRAGNSISSAAESLRTARLGRRRAMGRSRGPSSTASSRCTRE